MWTAKPRRVNTIYPSAICGGTKNVTLEILNFILVIEIVNKCRYGAMVILSLF